MNVKAIARDVALTPVVLLCLVYWVGYAIVSAPFRSLRSSG
jgi:hypothetical protein